ncbi:uncharacterized protein LOC126836053 [Adelges cooleyi]|uniref:uncharacterized protein LOC126836053 n=1 Tax=Adelges cooleyi TaxID=133065 RepID=UPI002180542C|nr:uncharacterized protein LOC126836053 [Adelges cooleyi]
MKKKSATSTPKTNCNVEETNLNTIKKKKLTSRQKKALTKVLEKKQKSQKRSDMLNELKSLELSAPTLSLMTSISQTQTTGLRNVMKEKKKQQTPKKSTINQNSSGVMLINEDNGINEQMKS